MTYRLSIFILVIAFVFSCKRNESSIAKTELKASVETAQGRYTFESNGPVFKVSYLDSNLTSPKDFLDTNFEAEPLNVEQKDNLTVVCGSEICAEIKHSPVTITYKSSRTQELISQQLAVQNIADTTLWRFRLETEEAIFGAGSRAIEMNRRGRKLEHFNKPQYGYGWGAENLNYSIPHLTSSLNYSLLFDNPGKSYFDIGNEKEDELQFEMVNGNMVYYLTSAASPTALLNQHHQLTGTYPLPPLWMFGHLQSRFGYRSQQQTMETVEAMQRANFPVDAVILDIYWFGPELEDGKMGQLDWDYENWPDPDKMISELKEKKIHCISISEPFFTKKSQFYLYLDSTSLLAVDSNGRTHEIPEFYFGNGGLLDIFKPEAKAWMWDQYVRLKSFGIDGWWVDLGEPEKHPAAMQHHNGMAHEVHGIYGHAWAQMLWEGYQDNFPNERIVQLGRSGYAGTQKYGMIPWTGDVGRSWSGLKSQSSMLQSASLSGLAYMHSDAGGFSMADQADEELYIRWMQMSAFSPIFRPHADEMIPPEVIFWSTDVQNILRPYYFLRYTLLPYNYTLAWHHYSKGVPMVQPVFFQFPGYDYNSDNYLWGSDFLISPVVEKGKQYQIIQLPEGSWYDFWSKEQFDGNQQINYPLELENIPVFVKAGSIIPQSKSMSNTAEYSGESLELHVYDDQGTYFAEIYFDDGVSMGYQQGKYQVMTVEANSTKERLTLRYTLAGDGFANQITNPIYNVFIYGLQSVTGVTVNSEKINYNSSGGALRFTWKMSNDSNVEIAK